MLKQRVITALILGALIILADFYLPDPAWGVLIAGIMAIAVREWCALVKINKLGEYALILISALPILYCSFVPRESIPDFPFFLGAVYLISASFWLFSVPSFLYFRIEPVGWYWRYFSVILMMLSAGLALIELRRAHPLVLLAALLLVSIADISAYFVGKKFGKNKLAPQISPGKTWEGVAGAVVGVGAFCLIVWAYTPEIQSLVGITFVFIFSIFAVLLCVQGDLYESLLKREAGVKDSGSILPGHGGVLDRIDAMLAFLPSAGALLLFVQLTG